MLPIEHVSRRLGSCVACIKPRCHNAVESSWYHWRLRRPTSPFGRRGRSHRACPRRAVTWTREPRRSVRERERDGGRRDRKKPANSCVGSCLWCVERVSSDFDVLWNETPSLIDIENESKDRTVTFGLLAWRHPRGGGFVSWRRSKILFPSSHFAPCAIRHLNARRTWS